MIEFVVILILVIASWTDIRTREVPDWLSYFGVAAGFGLRSINSVVENDFSILLSGFYGFVLFSVLGEVMFYTRQWGGGDTKMLRAVGALVGFSPGFAHESIAFLINGIITGALYGIVWTGFLAIRNFSKVMRTFNRIASLPIFGVFRVLLVVSLGLIGLMLWIVPSQLSFGLVLLGVLMVLLFYIGLLVRAVELSCMHRWVSPLLVTEGDWVAKPVRVGNKEICGPKDYGVELRQLRLLKRFYRLGKVKRVLVKEGMPFIPNFLLAYLVTVFFGNVVLLFV